MACCGLCRPKIKSTIKTKKHMTRKKLNQIDTWIENIESPYESIILPTKLPNKPNIVSNKEEIERSATSISSIEQDHIVINRKTKSARQTIQYLSPDISISEMSSSR